MEGMRVVGVGGMGVVGMALTIGFSVGLESERKKK